MLLVHYEDQYFYYFWKPAGIPSTFGKQVSFLAYLEKAEKWSPELKIFQYLRDTFGQDQEYGLLNRLDNDTSGLLYFAKTPEIKHKYKALQNIDKVDKIYLADVYGNFPHEEHTISWSIGHHKWNEDRMSVIKDSTDKKAIHGRLHKVTTQVKKLYYDVEANTTRLEVTIHKGIRHQIRAHLSSMGFPIVWEKIYIKKASPENLHLYSIGLKIDSFEV